MKETRPPSPRNWSHRFRGIRTSTATAVGKTTYPSVIGGVMVYRDHTHLAATHVTTLAPYPGRKVAAALRGRGVS